MFHVKQLEEGALHMGLELTEGQVRAFVAYHGLLLEWNRRVNLVSRADQERIIEHHFLDSLALVPHLDWPEGTEVLDLGSGAGFPGVPIRIVRPQVRLTLLDSRRKRVLFLNKLVSHLKLQDVRVICERAEVLGRQEEYLNRYQLITARSVAPPERLLPLALPLLAQGGKLVSFRGPDERADKLETNFPLSITHVPVRFPKPRTLVIIEKL